MKRTRRRWSIKSNFSRIISYGFKMLRLLRTNFEKIQKEHREMFKQSFANASSMVKDYRVRAEKSAKFITLQDKDMVEFAEERENLTRAHEERRQTLGRGDCP
ncbi:hypothetical protein CQW23_21116 [Capsicum baccatum]|uniref:Uncharacterized protein n=1 Tax=Capsicum baccatum TaxID=33114 RepID=A0A2G2VX76_CAPBA|nr:hypothetical protein CQW23_21116 [Capsicum baccatum]